MFTTGPVQMARSAIVEMAMDGFPDRKIGAYDFVIMHDDDLVIEADKTGVLGNPLDVWHDLFAKHPDVGVIGSVYLRESPQIPTVVMSHPDYPEENCHMVSGFGETPLSVAGIGTGFMMIRVSVLRALCEREPGYPMFRFPIRPTRWGPVTASGEDYDFCSRVREAGYKVIADPRWRTRHIKDTGNLVFDRTEWEAKWADDAPGIQERCAELKARCQPKMEFRVIRNTLCIDHVPQILSDAAADAAKKTARAA
jgi:hypothetical protein